MSLSANVNEKASLIWAIADKLTGVYKPHEYGEVILPLTVIRRFDCILADTKDAVLKKYEEVKNLPTRTCNRCGYDPLWKPNDDDSKCLRHTYNSWRYDEVFVWSPTDNNLSLEEAFDVWLHSQPTSWDQPVNKMIFGQIGWK